MRNVLLKIVTALVGIVVAVGLTLAAAPATAAPKAYNPQSLNVCFKHYKPQVQKCQIIPRYRERIVLESPFEPISVVPYRR